MYLYDTGDGLDAGLSISAMYVSRPRNAVDSQTGPEALVISCWQRRSRRQTNYSLAGEQAPQ